MNVYRCFLFCLLLVSANRSFANKVTPWQHTIRSTEVLMKTKPDSALVVLKELMTEAYAQNDQLLKATCLQQMGQLFYHYSNYVQAIDYLLEAEKLFRALKAREALACNLNYLGDVYYTNRQPQLAAKQFEEALSINTELQHKEGLASTYGNIGHLYEKRALYDSAFYYQRTALALYQSIANGIGVAKIYENIGSIFEDRERFDSAAFYFRQALLINEQNRDEIAQIEVLNNLGDIHRKTGDYAQGLLFTRQSLALAQKNQAQRQVASAYRDLARNYELTKNFDSAYFYNEKSRELVKEIYSAYNNLQIALLETVYKVAQKNDQIARLALYKKVNIIITAAIIAVILLLVVLGRVVFSRQRLKIKNEKALSEHNRHLYETHKGLMEAELKNKQLEEEKLKTTLELRGKELSAHTLHIIQKNQFLEALRASLTGIIDSDQRDQKKQLKQLAQKININFRQDAYWDEFITVFNQVHQSFFTNLNRYADSFTPAELKLVALLRMNLNSGDIATLLGISPDSLRVSRYRLRKKLNIAEGESLTAFLLRL